MSCTLPWHLLPRRYSRRMWTRPRYMQKMRFARRTKGWPIYEWQLVLTLLLQRFSQQSRWKGYVISYGWAHNFYICHCNKLVLCSFLRSFHWFWDHEYRCCIMLSETVTSFSIIHVLYCMLIMSLHFFLLTNRGFWWFYRWCRLCI